MILMHHRSQGKPAAIAISVFLAPVLIKMMTSLIWSSYPRRNKPCRFIEFPGTGTLGLLEGRWMERWADLLA